jgi:hypothetical protein
MKLTATLAAAVLGLAVTMITICPVPARASGPFTGPGEQVAKGLVQECPMSRASATAGCSAPVPARQTAAVLMTRWSGTGYPNAASPDDATEAQLEGLIVRPDRDHPAR